MFLILHKDREEREISENQTVAHFGLFPTFASLAAFV
ncbi:hypothetical protein OPIT5_05760 [Opitutaceae bacterium TAV5]|nr:hypothetical protein OPIT5_05760 [Opitutaceae bacterium TAV5]